MMKVGWRSRITVVMIVVWILWWVPLSAQTTGAPSVSLRSQIPERLSLRLGQSILINTDMPIKRVSLADPAIADTLVISPQQLYVIGKGIGTTNLTLWGNRGKVFTIVDLAVQPDLNPLKEKIQQVLPSEHIQVTSAHDAVTLFGEVSSAIYAAQAVTIAEAFVPNKVLNLLQVTGVHQVMLEVRVAEMSRSLTRRLGVNLGAIASANFFGVSLLNNLASISPAAPPLTAPLEAANTVNALLRFQSGGVTVTGFIDALKENGLVKILAEPTLVTISGQEASFLAGGEFPIPVPQDNGNITIEFRSFGVALSFTPTVLSKDKISIEVAPEVSELDFTNAVRLADTQVPGLAIRRASTTVEMGDGQSFAIAGLLRETARETVSKFPLLGDIPILGALFRSSSFTRGETELVIIVTPRLVKPLDMTRQTLPTDAFIEPNDLEFFLFGKIEGKRSGPAVSGKLDGPFGYIVNPLGGIQ